MAISNPHNINEPAAETPVGTYGVRVSLPEGDPFTHLLADDWTTTHWFATAADRDKALHDMQRTHEFSRPHDKPTLIFEAVSRDTIA
ncbi:MAG: hypothetical protein HKN56_03460 [Gammaproteobacteria bacterium]|nr:hypothetical protein [Gammaproteobacteria bacterium]